MIIFHSIRMFFLTYSSFGISWRLRDLVYRKLIKLPMEYYDDTKNSPGSLVVYLGSDVELIKNLTSTLYSILAGNLASLISGFGIAFYASWRMSFFFYFSLLKHSIIKI